MERQKNKGSRGKKRGALERRFFFLVRGVSRAPSLQTEVFLCAWSLVYTTALCNMPFWNMTKTVESQLLTLETNKGSFVF